MNTGKNNTYLISSSILYRNYKTLEINFQQLNFSDDESSTVIDANDIIAYKFGIRWIKGIEFTIGREYQIFIESKSKGVLEIKFKTYYSYKNNELFQKYSSILDDLWKVYFDGIAANFIKLFYNNETFNIGDIFINQKGVIINLSGIFSMKPQEIPWKNVRTQDYQTYFSIYSSENPSKINRGYSYLEDWNTTVLYCVLRTILRDKKIENHHS